MYHFRRRVWWFDAPLADKCPARGPESSR